MHALSMRRCERSRAYGAHRTDVKGGEAPNKRLKLPGDDRLKGTGVFAPWGARTFVHYSCASGRVARSLTAIR